MDELAFIPDESRRIDLERDLQEIIQTEAFSAIVSSAETEEDLKRLRFLLVSAGLSTESCQTDDNVREIAQYIASRIVGGDQVSL